MAKGVKFFFLKAYTTGAILEIEVRINGVMFQSEIRPTDRYTGSLNKLAIMHPNCSKCMQIASHVECISADKIQR